MELISKTVLANVGQGKVYIPSEVICRKNISDNTKLLFGIIFNECLSKMESIDENSVSQMTYIIKDYCTNVPLHSIEKDCLCGMKAAELIQKELASLTATLDIAACFYNCKLNYARVIKPVCRMCENGKTLYKMLDLVNTLIDRQINKTSFNKVFSDSEMELLKKYNENHSPEFLDEVIDILKR